MSPLHLTEGESAEIAKLRDDLSSAVADQYSVGAVLGVGRSGVVFHARKTETSRVVALKVAWEDPAARAQVARETSVTSELAHQFVLPMQKLHLGKRIFVIEMPLALGGTLDQLFDRGSGASFHYVRGILRQVASALDHAHAQGIVHGSISPVKILLDENGQCLVSDFGLRSSRQLGGASVRPSELGAPAYMPIEQRRDRADLDGRIDQYALGVIAYELLRGRRTWQVSAEDVFAVEAIEINPTRAIAHGVPLSATVAIKRATSLEPGQRYASVADFVQAFSADSADTPSTALRAPRRPGALRRRAMFLAPFALVLALGIAGSKASVRDKVRALWPASWSLGSEDSGGESELPAFPDTGSLDTLGSAKRSGGDVARMRRKNSAKVTPLTTAPRPSTGVITVTLAGGSSAFVIIDGQTRGGTPLTWRASAGRHIVSLRGEDKYSPPAMSVNLAGGDTAIVAFTAATRR
jgi:serine/threonine protein kinase